MLHILMKAKQREGGEEEGVQKHNQQTFPISLTDLFFVVVWPTADPGSICFCAPRGTSFELEPQFVVGIQGALILAGNSIGPVGAQAIADALLKNSTLQHLDLHSVLCLHACTTHCVCVCISCVCVCASCVLCLFACVASNLQIVVFVLPK